MNPVFPGSASPRSHLAPVSPTGHVQRYPCPPGRSTHSPLCPHAPVTPKPISHYNKRDVASNRSSLQPVNYNGSVCVTTRQESPPVWTQEAYHPPRSKCSLWWSVWGGGVSPSSPHRPGYPSPCWDWMGVLQSGLQDWSLGLDRGIPNHHQDWMGIPPIWTGWGTPLPWWKHYFPSPFGCER